MMSQTLQASFLRFALYMRVSTGRQAEKDLSIPDQERTLETGVRLQGGTVARKFVDTGSATSGNRPELQRVRSLVETGQADFDVLFVHSFSRFFRNVYEALGFIQLLRQHGIEIVSLTQPVPPGPAGDMIRLFFMTFDEYQSKETAKHVERSMRENARQGYWGGGKPPFGFTTEEAGIRGNTIKKKLAIEPSEAGMVRLIFELYLKGDGTAGPLGVKRVTQWLNEHGYRNRYGSRWAIGKIHRILTDRALIGIYEHGRTRKGVEPIPVSVPAIISVENFDAVQHSLRERNPKKTPRRVVTGPILLTGLATCGCCGAGMTTRTGKGGRYRYYACGNKISKGISSCPGKTVPMEDLDRLITDHVVRELLTPARVRSLLEELLKRQLARADRNDEILAKMREKRDDAEIRLRRLHDAIANGVMDSSEPSLKKMIGDIVGERDLAQMAIDRANTESAPTALITDERIHAFVDLMRTNITEGTIEFRRAYLRAVIREIQIRPEGIRIIGVKPDVERAILQFTHRGVLVPTFVPGWRRE